MPKKLKLTLGVRSAIEKQTDKNKNKKTFQLQKPKRSMETAPKELLVSSGSRGIVPWSGQGHKNQGSQLTVVGKGAQWWLSIKAVLESPEWEPGLGWLWLVET